MFFKIISLREPLLNYRCNRYTITKYTLVYKNYQQLQSEKKQLERHLSKEKFTCDINAHNTTNGNQLNNIAPKRCYGILSGMKKISVACKICIATVAMTTTKSVE